MPRAHAFLHSSVGLTPARMATTVLVADEAVQLLAGVSTAS
ncbi:MAG TPA: hypothetical protein ACQGQI_04925 [Xylella sp.]